MYSGTNPSALRSQKWISQALLELMQTQNFNTITIKAICSRADLTRQTFYQFFQTKEDVLRYLLQGYYEEFEKHLLTQPYIGLEVLAESFFGFFNQYRSFVMLLAEHHLDYLLTEQFSLVLPKIMCISDEEGYALTQKPHIQAFLVGGLSAMLLSWIRSEDVNDEEELTRSFLELFHKQKYTANHFS